MNLLENFAKKNNIPSGEFLRCSINFTFADKNERSEIHQDHDFPHKQLIIYLNESDKKATTVILDDDKKTVLKEIEPEQFKGVCFENKPHYLNYPKKGYRVICVYTFR